MTNAVILLAIVLPAVAWFPLERLLEDLSLCFSSLDCLLGVVVLAVFALAGVLVAHLSVSKADTIHLLALSFGASALLLRLVFLLNYLIIFCRCLCG